MCGDNEGSNTQANDQVDDEHRKTVFYDTRNVYVTHRYDQSIHKDKHLLTLSAAALGLSVTYIDKIVQIDKAVFVPLLMSSWLLFGISLVSVIFSYHYSVPCYDDYIREIDDKFINDADIRDVKSRFTKRIDGFNCTAMWTFVIGLALFMLFITVNLIRKVYS